MRNKVRDEIFDYVRDTYNTIPEYLWEKTPDAAVLRHLSNKKWYAVIMNVKKDRLGLKGNGTIDIIDLKCEPEMIGSLVQKDGFFRAYHMSKEKWLTVVLDGTVPNEEIITLIDLSFELTDTKINTSRTTDNKIVND